MMRLMLMMVGILLVTVGGGVAFADDGRFVLSAQSVKDKHTGLIWTRDAHLGHCDWDGAFELVKKLNGMKYAGFNDWRLPTKEQLMTLATYANTLDNHGIQGSRTPAEFLNKIGFYNVMEDYYWSSSYDSFEIKFAWSVYMSDGTLCNPNKYIQSYIWPVRGGK